MPIIINRTTTRRRMAKNSFPTASSFEAYLVSNVYLIWRITENSFHKEETSVSYNNKSFIFLMRQLISCKIYKKTRKKHLYTKSFCA